MTRSRTRPNALPRTPHRMRAVIYTRVSRDDRRTGRSVKEQEEECRRVIESFGWELIKVYCDNNVSASEYSTTERPDWKQLGQALEADEFDVLVVWEPSRATRDQVTWAALSTSCKLHHVKIYANDKLYDLNEPEDAFLLNLFFALAERESAMTRKRVRRASDAGVKEAKPGPGRPAFGYRRVYNPSTGAPIGLELDTNTRIAISPDGKTVTEWNPYDLMRKIYKDVLNRKTPYQLVIELNALGIPNPMTAHALAHHPARDRSYRSDWVANAILPMLINPVYLGKRRHLGAVVGKQGEWPALIDEETYYAIKKKVTQKQTGPTPRPSNAKHLLSRLALCTHCDLPIQYSVTRQIPGYRCRFGKLWLPLAGVNTFVVKWLISELSNTDLLARLQALANSPEELKTARGKLEKLEEELEGWRIDAIKGEVDRELYKRRAAELNPQIEAAREQAQAHGIPPVLKGVLGPNAAKVWHTLKIPAQQDIIRTVVEIRIVPVGRGRRNVPLRDRISFTPLLH